MADERRSLEGYASPALRWAMFLEDHPTAPPPTYGTATAAELDLDDEWLVNTQGFVTATIHFPAGTDRDDITAWKEVPEKVKHYSDMVAFAKTPENLVKLRTQALGRALKQAGYPDGIDDLRPLITWRRRLLELSALADGRPVPTLAIGTGNGDDITPASGVPSPDADREDVIDAESDEAPPGDAIPHTQGWPMELAELTAQLSPAAQADVWAFAAKRGIGPDSSEGKLKTVIAFARSKVPKGTPVSAQKPIEAPAATEQQELGSEAPTAPENGQSGESEPNPEVDNLLARYDALDEEVRGELDAEMENELIAWADLDGDATALARVAELLDIAEQPTVDA